MSSTQLLRLSDLAVSFGANRVLDGIDLSVDEGELLVLLGPSGCGKSTLLRAIAGLQPLESGSVRLRGQNMNRNRPDERGIGLMFQDEVLFPHFDVAGNVEFGLRMQGWDRQQRRLRVAEMLNLVGLSGFENRDVATLSGGEAQRVGLARSVAPRPDLLLLDEPFGALDRPLRERLVGELGPLLAAQGVTAVHVTHDHDEAFALGHRLALMFAGRLAAVGTPEEVWQRPDRVEVARFLGHRNTFEVAEWELLTGHSVTDVALVGASGGLGESSHIAVRADLVRLRLDGRSAADDEGGGTTGEPATGGGTTGEPPTVHATMYGTVAGRRFAGDRYELQVKLSQHCAAEDAAEVVLEVRTSLGPPLGAQVTLEIPTDSLIALSA